ncbi:MAG: hypothetical protein KGP12_12705 [Actinomycetales bacterium]|nr:hypothetical protein [Actinomycetales bacterium]
MSSQEPELGTPTEPPPQGAYVVMRPEMDLVQKGENLAGIETRVIALDD